MALNAVYDIIAIGRPVVDITGQVEPSFLESISLRPGEQTEVTPRQLRVILDQLPSCMMRPGGSLSNTLAGMNALGERTAFVGKACGDEPGRLFREAFRTRRIAYPTCDIAPDCESSTALCLFLKTPEGPDAIVFSRGVADRLTEADLATSLLTSCRLLYVEANLLCSPESRAALVDVLDWAKKAAVPVTLSLHSIESRNYELADTHIKQCAVVIGNQDEYVSLFGSSDLTRFTYGSTQMVMTAGSEGAMVAGDGAYICVPPHRSGPMTDVDGTGDQFAAGYLTGYLAGKPPRRCAEFGNATADAILGIPDVRPSGDWSGLRRKYAGSPLPVDNPRRGMVAKPRHA